MENAQRKKRKNNNIKRVYLLLRPLIVILISLAITIGCLSVVINVIVKKYLSPVDINDPTPIEFVIEDGWGASTIAKYLFEACGEGKPGLISNKAVFKIYVDFMGKSKDLRAGKYYLSKNMDIPAIIDTLCKGGTDTETVRITIPEGTTIEGIVRILKENSMNIDQTEFLELCKTGEAFTDYKFINNVFIAEEERIYALEGYLFPDTYDFFINASSVTVITKMLDRYQDICYGEEGDEASYAERAKELGMSMDEVTSLAALIEKEAVLDDDFYKVSAVFHNRLEDKMLLQSDAPLAYLFFDENSEKKLIYTSEEMEVDSPYNTHVYKGVPIGPICNPGKIALDAALNPNSEFVSDGYLYFCLMDSKTGELVFAKTLEEHNANVAKYSPQWEQ